MSNQRIWTDHFGNLFEGEDGTIPIASSAEVLSIADELLEMDATAFDCLDFPGGDTAANLLRKIRVVAGSAKAWHPNEYQDFPSRQRGKADPLPL
jgi:hypothetical protein